MCAGCAWIPRAGCWAEERIPIGQRVRDVREGPDGFSMCSPMPPGWTADPLGARLSVQPAKALTGQHGHHVVTTTTVIFRVASIHRCYVRPLPINHGDVLSAILKSYGAAWLSKSGCELLPFVIGMGRADEGVQGTLRRRLRRIDKPKTNNYFAYQVQSRLRLYSQRAELRIF
jgi:hypothetical protein